jgi:hypothetical protein
MCLNGEWSSFTIENRLSLMLNQSQLDILAQAQDFNARQRRQDVGRVPYNPWFVPISPRILSSFLILFKGIGPPGFFLVNRCFRI